MKTTHWFFTNSNTLMIWTYALGDRPAQEYRFEDEKDFNNKIKALKEDGYKFERDQSK
jgi:hypothetical protein